ncbi:hypothetical protein MJH12_04360, partial [bacterium]|nr:hypothetical protein [bacterium]
YVLSKAIDLKYYQEEKILFDDYTYNDFHGLELLASTILQVTMASGLKVKENHYQKYILPGATVTRNSFSSDLSAKNDLKIYQNKRVPLSLVFSMDSDSISVGLYSYIPPKETYDLKLDFYKSLYPKIEAQEDFFLEGQAVQILVKPLNGLLSQFKRQIFRQGVQVAYRRLKKRKIWARDGMILVGKEIQNIYDPKVLYNLGLKELSLNKDTNH